MIKNVPIKEIGIAKTGISVVRQFLRKTKRINTTKRNAMNNVSATSVSESLIDSVVSSRIVKRRSSGKSCLI